MESEVRRLEFWRWRYRDLQTGTICRTSVALTEEEALAKYPDAQRIEGTRSVRYTGGDGVDCCETREAADRMPEESHDLRARPPGTSPP
jgi:hypothetical protein